MLAGTIESCYWATLPTFFTASIQHVITCLYQLQRWMEAIVLHQFAPVINYPEVFRLVREKAPSLDAGYFEFVWDAAISEILIYTLANVHPDNAKLELLVCVSCGLLLICSRSILFKSPK